MEKDLIAHTAEFVKRELMNAESGHDWWHVFRVYKNAMLLLEHEPGADKTTVELGALLHDIADAKFHNGDEEKGPAIARAFLESEGVDEATISGVDFIIRNISYRKSKYKTKEISEELKIVQDADRLDALGAIGIARAFSYGGFKNRVMFDPEIPPAAPTKNKRDTPPSDHTINHFYEKLLLLKDQMNTKTGKRIAEQRHRFLETFLDQFLMEWEGDF